MTNTSGKKKYLVGKVLGGDENIPATLMKPAGVVKMEYILQTDNKKEAEAVAKWHKATVVEV